MTNNLYIDLSVVCRYRSEAVAGKEQTSTLHFISGDFDNSIFKLDVRLGEGKKVNISATLKKPVAIELFSIRFKIRKNGPVAGIDRFYDVSEIDEEIWNNSLTPLFISFSNNEHNFLLYNSGRLFSHKVINYADFFELIIFIDAAAEHPCWDFTDSKQSIASPVLPAGTTYNLEFSFLRSPMQTKNVYPVMTRYPYGVDAAFIITDHCDFDDHQKLNTFLYGNTDGNGGWLNKGLKITKGIFTMRSAGINAKTNDTLETPEYKALIKELYNDGNEIAAHALNQSGQITAEEFLSALNRIQHDFEPKTWIDHGLYLHYCYYMGGKYNSSYQLTKTLQQKNYTSLWSYQDVPVDPAKSLNHFNNSRGTLSFGRITKKILRGKFLAAGHDLKSSIQRKDEAVNRYTSLLAFVSSGRSLLMNIRSPKKRKRAIEKTKIDFFNLCKRSSAGYLPYSREELINFSPALYLETAKPLHQLAANDLVMFATQEITQLNGVYTEQALNKLIGEKGLHIGHTYILNDLPYIEGIFEKNKKNKLSTHWIKFVNALSQKIENGEIWNPNLSEFIGYVKQCCAVSLEYLSEKAMVVRNSGSRDVNGLTFMIHVPARVSVLWDKKKPASRLDDSGNVLFWGNVPANSQSVIEWQ
jgi:hypothetical protein